MTAKTGSERMDKWTKKKRAQGKTGRTVYAHPEDWPKIRQLERELAEKREKNIKASEEFGNW